MIIAQPVLAQAIKVSALQPFSSVTPSETLKVVALETVEFKNGIKFEDGAIIKGKIIDVKGPKRGKLNASFKFQPIEYTYNGKTTMFEDENFIGKYKEYKELDKGELAISAASGIGGFFVKVPGFGQAVSFTKGFIKDPENNRLKSGATQIYKDSPLVYIEEGHDVEIQKDQLFILNFKTTKEENLDEEKAEETIQEQDINNSEPVENSSVPIINPNASQNVELTPQDPEQVLNEIEMKTK